MRLPTRKIIRSIKKIIPDEKSPKATTKTNYYSYLESETWFKKRQEILERDSKRCRLCDSSKNPRVHHRKYPKVYGEEPNEDLITLCAKCHDLFHRETAVLQASGKQNKRQFKSTKKIRREKRKAKELSIIIQKQSEDILSESKNRWRL